MILIPSNVREVILISIILFVLGLSVVINNSKNKNGYDKATGIIEYFDKKFQHLPVRNKEDFRYLKINSYPYIFEIYKSNSEPTQKTLDDLKVGDKIDIYYYETPDVKEDKLNRFAQFIDHEGVSCFIRNGFKKQMGFAIIGLSILFDIIVLWLWKKGKFPW